ncbi:hypothetical protein L208DRAFT_1008229, partial [Tricholoma matsutake]
AEEEYPTTDMRWGLAAKQGTFTGFHIDADGLATAIYCVNKGGLKWWIIIGPKDKRDTSPFASVENAYAFHNHGLDVAVLGDVQVEVVLLTPGVRLILHPNTPYRILTVKSSTYAGRLFYSLSTITESCIGVLQSFVGTSLSCEPGLFQSSRLLLARMLIYLHQQFVLEAITETSPGQCPYISLGHLPDLETIDGILAVLSLINLAELANVLHPNTYQGGVD